MELEEQVQQLGKLSSVKDTLIEKYKMEYKEGEHLYEYNEKCAMRSVIIYNCPARRDET